MMSYEDEMYGPVPEGGTARGYERLLWFCAGANARALERCPHSDRVKYQGIGGVVLATGFLAFFSGMFAFYTIFSPKTGDLHPPNDPLTWAGACVLGFIWSAIIFNLDRFIVSSTGKGDGTDQITRAEIRNAIPRIFMAVVIGLCMSAPLEIKVLEPEIKDQLVLEQGEREKQRNTAAETLRDEKKHAAKEIIDSASARIIELEAKAERDDAEVNGLRTAVSAEASGQATNGVVGEGPGYRAKVKARDDREAEVRRDKERFEQEEAGLRKTVELEQSKSDAADAECDAARAKNKNDVKNFDGLLERIKISHAIGGCIPWIITALLLSIECGPIFFKMMLIKGTYDYMEENEKHVRAARLGIVSEAKVYVDENNRSVLVDTFLRAERIAAEEQHKTDTQKKLSLSAHEAFRQKTVKEIQADPIRFIVTGERHEP